METTINGDEKKTIDMLVKNISKLSDEGRARLLKLIGAMDLGKFKDADIRIDDWKGMDKQYPRATIQLDDGTEETIDIFKTVRENATSIGHPAILLAIRRWEHIILYNSALRSKGEYYKFTEEGFYDIAQHHLQSIGQALISGAKNRALNSFSAISLRRTLGIDKDYVYLRWVWELLDRKTSFDKPFSDRFYSANTEKQQLNLLQQKMKEIAYMWINLREVPVVQLQASPSLRDYINMRIRYTPTKPGVKIKLPDETVNWYFLDDAFNWALDLDVAVWLKPVEGPYCWIKLSELLKQREIKHSSINKQITLGDLLDKSCYTLPPYGLKPRERKLAALLGHKEFASELSEESFKKKTVDLIIEFLKSAEWSKYLTTRPKWEIFLSSFDNWRFGVKKNTLRIQRNREKNKAINREKNEALEKDSHKKGHLMLDGTFIPPMWLKGIYLLPDFLNEYSFNEINNWLSLPINLARKTK